MPDMESLYLFAELSIGLLGFSGVVSALGRSRLSVDVRRFRINALLSFSTVTCFASLLPILLNNYAIEPERLWVICSIMLVAGILVGPSVTAFSHSEIMRTDPFLRVVRIPIFALLAVILIYVGYGLFFAREDLSAIYLVGVSYLLAMGIFHFCMLVASIQFDEE